ncbi:MAG: hypothetical protein GXY08_08470 [Ruminococcus sp.]|nr:hypothetical protein [Ruminococcus sp.]
MRRRYKKKTAIRAIFLYLLFSGGSWMFINCYTNSYNRLSGEKIAPASLDMNENKASFTVLEHSAEVDLSVLSYESRAYCIAYLLSPDEVRSTGYLISVMCDI